MTLGGVVLVGLVGFTGCDHEDSPDLTKVSGLITYRGKPLTNGDIAFEPVAETGRSGSGLIGADGRYEIFTSRSWKGVQPGEYRVRIDGREPIPGNDEALGKLVIPPKYLNLDTSGLRVTVEKRRSQTIDFALDD